MPMCEVRLWSFRVVLLIVQLAAFSGVLESATTTGSPREPRVDFRAPPRQYRNVKDNKGR